MAEATSGKKVADPVAAAGPQEDKDREQALKQAPGGLGTATGQARADLAGDLEEIKGAARGSQVPIAGGAPGADFAEGSTKKPQGMQAEAAAFTSNGSIPAGMVSSPAGLVPLGAVDGDVEGRLQDTLSRPPIQTDYRALSESEIEQLDGPTLRAVAADRGYEIPGQFGARSARRAFLDAQKSDRRALRGKS